MPPRKEDQIQIPEAVLNRANAAAMRGQAIADTGSIFTERERSMPRQVGGMGYPSGPFQQGGLPRFPFGGASSTSLDTVDRDFNWSAQQTPAGGFTRTNPNTSFESVQNQKNVQYIQDAATRMANRYTLPTGAFGSPFGSRLSNTLYSDPERAANIESRGAELNAYNPLTASPNVGAAGFSRNIETGAGGRTEQIVSPYGFASTNLTPQQVEQRALARQEAEQKGTMPRTPEQQQALLAQARQTGAAIGRTMRERETQRQQELTKGYYAFRQGLEQDRFQRAMSQAEKEQARGGSGREAMRRAEQARYGGEIMRQAGANVGTGQRTPFFSWERASMPSGEQFYRGSMGQYSRVTGTGGQFGGIRGGPQPAAATSTAPQTSQAFNLMTPMPALSSPQTSFGSPSYSGFNLFDPLRGIYGA